MAFYLPEPNFKALKKTWTFIWHISTADQCAWNSCAQSVRPWSNKHLYSFGSTESIFYWIFFCFCSTASNSNRSSPACSPVLHKRSRSPTPQSPEGENMVERAPIIPLINPPPPRNKPSSAPTASRFTPPATEGKLQGKVCDCAYCTSALSVFIYCMSCTLIATVGSNFISLQVLKSILNHILNCRWFIP